MSISIFNRLTKTASREDLFKQAEQNGQIQAIHKVMAVIEFDLEGNILAINEKFAAATGYSAQEVIGHHHSMFVSEELKNSPEYQLFWQKLAQGTPVEGQFKRLGKHGKPIWLQASYNPILAENGKPYKVIKRAMNTNNFGEIWGEVRL